MARPERASGPLAGLSSFLSYEEKLSQLGLFNLEKIELFNLEKYLFNVCK